MTALTTLAFRRVKNYILPPVSERMRTAFAVIDFSQTPLVEYDLSYAMNDGTAIVIQSVTVDNSANDAPVDIVSDKALKFSRRVNAGELRVFNIPAIDPSFISFESAGTGTCKIYMHNFPSLPDSQQVDPALGGVAAPAYVSTVEEVTDTAADILPLNPQRKYLMIQNNHATGVIYLAFGRDATADDYQIVPGGFYEPNTAPGSLVSMLSDIASNPNVAIIEG